MKIRNFFKGLAMAGMMASIFTGASPAMSRDEVCGVARNAVLASIEGQVTVRIGRDRYAGRSGMRLPEGAVVKTAANSHALVIINGSRMDVPASSVLNVHKYNGALCLVLEESGVGATPMAGIAIAGLAVVGGVIAIVASDEDSVSP